MFAGQKSNIGRKIFDTRQSQASVKLGKARRRMDLLVTRPK